MTDPVTLDAANDAIEFIVKLRSQTNDTIRATHPDLIAAAGNDEPEVARASALRRTGALFDTILDVLTGAEIEPGAN